MTVKRDFVVIAIFSLLYSLLTFWVDNSYYQLIMTIVPIWAVMGLSWNLLSGYSGLISFGHAAFFGLGAYLVALLLSLYNISPWLSIPLASLVGAISGLLVGLVTFRLRGHYFALAMLAYPLALLYIFEWLGFQEIALPMKREAPAFYMQFSDPSIYTLLALLLLVASLVITTILTRSRFGMSLLALKQDEEAAEASGINTLGWKLAAITVSAAMASTAGAYYAVVLLVVTPPAVFGMLVSAQALIIAMFGGAGTLWGPVIGAFILVPLSEILHANYASQFPGIQGVIYGVAIIVVILLAPEGLVWRLRKLLRLPPSEPSVKQVPSTNNVAGSTLPLFAPEAGSVGNIHPILSIRHLSKAFGGLQATDNLSFDIFPGEILGIIGPNGAGKTTLFNLLNGFLEADQGDIIFQTTSDNQSLTKLKPNQICRLGIARTFQVAKPFSKQSVFDNVILGAFACTSNDDDAAELAISALQMVDLIDFMHLTASTLTNKQHRQMELARALAGKPKLILVDEILAGLDSEAALGLVKTLRNVSHYGITIVIIEHSMKAMVSLVDRFIVLNHGSLLAQGKPNEITQNENVIEAYLGKKWMRDNAKT